MTDTVTMTSEASHLRGWADAAGLFASIGCAIHCAAMPMVLAYLPTLGLGWLASERFHQWMAVICFLLAASAFVPGWRKHRSFVPAIWGFLGLSLLTTAAFGIEGGCCATCGPGGEPGIAATSQCETCDTCTTRQVASETTTQSASLGAFGPPGWMIPFVTPAGGLLLVVGHVVNHRKSCRCGGATCCLPEIVPDSPTRGPAQSL